MAHARLAALKGSIVAGTSLGSYVGWGLGTSQASHLSHELGLTVRCSRQRCLRLKDGRKHTGRAGNKGLDAITTKGHVTVESMSVGPSICSYSHLSSASIVAEGKLQSRVGSYRQQATSRRLVTVLASAADVAAPLIAEPTTGGSLQESHGHSVERPSWKANIDFKSIRDNKEAVRQNIINRNGTADVDKVVELYEEFIRKTMEVDKLRAQRNNVANSMKGKVEPERRAELVEEGKRLKDVLSGLEGELDLLSDELQREGQRVPNSTHPDVPVGGEELATLRKEVGSQREFSFPVKDHVELGLALDLFDFDSASEVSGTKFYYLKNEAVLLEMALINWALSQLIARGYKPLSTPDLVRSTVLEKCGFQPRAANTQVYSVEGMDLCLTGTAEIPVGGMHMDKILAESELPLKLVAFSHCFRTEAGAAGAATRGLYRVHQFSKVEIFILSTPEESDRLHEELISIEEELYASLGLHFKTLDMSTEDLGAPAYRKFDVEAWMPGLGRYGEISSASNCTDYQARRLNIRYRPQPHASQEAPPSPGKTGGKKGKQNLPPPRFVHTLNATACAVPRMIISILENFQQEDGSIVVPEPLRPFMGGLDVIRPKGTTQ